MIVTVMALRGSSYSRVDRFRTRVLWTSAKKPRRAYNREDDADVMARRVLDQLQIDSDEIEEEEDEDSDTADAYKRNVEAVRSSLIAWLTTAAVGDVLHMPSSVRAVDCRTDVVLVYGDREPTVKILSLKHTVAAEMVGHPDTAEDHEDDEDDEAKPQHRPKKPKKKPKFSDED